MNLTKYQSKLRIAPTLPLEVKATDGGQIEGYASTFGGAPDRHGEVVEAGAFTKSLASHKREGTAPVMLWAHKLEEPIGRWDRLEQDEKGLFVSGQVNLKTTKGREAFEHVKSGDVGAFSIGFIVPDGGRRYAGEGVFHLKEVELVEVSIVAVPANPKARITSAKQLQTKCDAIDFLRAAGLSKLAAKRFVAGGFSALQNDEDSFRKAQQLAAHMDAAINSMRQTK